MNNSVIFKAAVRFLVPIILLISVQIFWRGHNAPGGGFIGGLIAATAFLIYALACGAQKTRHILYFAPTTFIGWGLFAAGLSGFLGWSKKAAYFAGAWVELPVIGALGSPVLFDLGVYILVLGFSMHVLLTLLEENI